MTEELTAARLRSPKPHFAPGACGGAGPRHALRLLNTTNHIVYAFPAVSPDVWSEAVTPPSFLMSSDDDAGMMEPPIQNTGFVSRSAADCAVKALDDDEPLTVGVE